MKILSHINFYDTQNFLSSRSSGLKASWSRIGVAEYYDHAVCIDSVYKHKTDKQSTGFGLAREPTTTAVENGIIKEEPGKQVPTICFS